MNAADIEGIHLDDRRIADEYVIDREIVAARVDGAVLRVGPGEGVLAGRQFVGEGLPFILILALCEDDVAVDRKVAVIPERAGAFAPCLEVELDAVALVGCDDRGNRGGGA